MFWAEDCQASGGKLEQASRFGIGLRYATASLVEQSKGVLGIQIPSVGGKMEELYRLGVGSIHAAAGQVQVGEVRLGDAVLPWPAASRRSLTASVSDRGTPRPFR